MSIRRAPPRIVASAIKSHVHTWFLCVALVGRPVERPRRTSFRLVGGTRSPSSRRRRRTLALAHAPAFLPQERGNPAVPVPRVPRGQGMDPLHQFLHPAGALARLVRVT